MQNLAGAKSREVLLWLFLFFQRREKTVGRPVKDAGHADGAEHVENRMLLQEYRGETDQHADHVDNSANPAAMFKCTALSSCQHDADGIVDMQTGKNIRVGVRLIEEGSQVCENVFFRIDVNSQILSIVEQRADNQKERHAAECERTELIEFSSVVEEEKNKGTANVHEPEQVGDDKIFDKGNIVVQFTVDAGVGCHISLQPQEPRHINGRIQCGPDVAVFQ